MRERLPVAVTLLALVVVLLCGTAAGGAVIYVKPAGSDSSGGLSWPLAKKTVQAGLNTASSGDEVWVAAGTYAEIITLKSGVALYGGFAGNETSRASRNWRANRAILDGGSLGSVVTCPQGATASTRIDGFTIRNGRGTARAVSGEVRHFGGGIYCHSSSPTIANNTISANSVSQAGGGIYCDTASPIITANIITDNTALTNGAGIHCDNSSPDITNNLITLNRTTTQSGISQGGGIYCGPSSAPLIANNTIVENTVPGMAGHGGGICCKDSSPRVMNNIIAFNSSGIQTSGLPTLRNNCVHGNSHFDYLGVAPGSGDINQDPTFVDRAGGNHHLQSGSPCVNRGHDPIVSDTWRDIDGQGRTYGIHVDIGADEFWPPPTVQISTPTAEPTYSTTNQVLAITGAASDGTETVNWSNDRGGSGVCSGTISWSAGGIVLQSGQNVITVTARDAAGFASADTLTVAYSAGAPANVVYVRPGGNDNSDGLSWITAKRSVQAAINAAKAGWEVWVAAGSYVGVITLKSGVALYGGFSGSEMAREHRRFARNVTTLDGGGASSVVKASAVDGSTRVDGFTIRNGSASNGGGIYCYNSSLTIANNLIRANSVTQGHGGGVFCSGGSVVLAGNVIFDNLTSGQGLGGGIYLYGCGGGTTVVNNTIADNNASQGGGVYIYNCSSQMQISNNIVAFNSSGLAAYGGAPNLRNNNVYGNAGPNYSGGLSPGQGDISKDPLFANRPGRDYHLKQVSPPSPCVDAGWNTARDIPSFDIDGQGRRYGPADIGADEIWPAAAVAITSPTSDPAYLTANPAIDLAGSAAEGVITVSWSSDRGAAGLCSGTTSWNAAGIPLGIGRNVITVSADAVTSVATAVLDVIFDAAPPSVVIAIPTAEPNYSTNDQLLSIAGTATDDVGVLSVSWANDRGGAGTCSGTNPWSAAGISLATGVNLIAVTAVDVAGKTSTARLTVTYLDTAGPVVTITSPTTAPTYPTNNPTLTLSGTAADPSGVASVAWSNDRGGSGACVGTASWTAKDIPLAQGANIVTVTALDGSGNSGESTITVNYDSVAPTIAITNPTAQPTYATNSARLTIGGTASDDTGVTGVTWLNNRGGSGSCTGTASWSAEGIVLTPGSNVITVTARDAAGNTAAATLTVAFTDTTPPTVTITSPTAEPTHSTNSAAISIAGTASDDAGLVSLAWSNNRGGAGMCTGTSSWDATAIALKVGVNVITVTATDSSGNTGTDTLAVTFTDTTPPMVTITAPTADPACARSCSSLSISGTASDDVEVAAVYWSSDRGGAATCAGTTSWSAQGIVLQPGANVITVTAVDSTGNSGTDSLTVTWTEASPGDAWLGLAMVSVPLVPDATDPRQVVGFSGDDWMAYSPVSGSYSRYPDRMTWFQPAASTPMRGFWAHFDVAPPSPCGTIPPQDESVVVHLSPGWNLVGQPFLAALKWDTSRIMVQEFGGSPKALRDSAAAVAGYAWGWDNVSGAYYLIYDSALDPGVVGELRPWCAYWIRAYKSCELILPTP